MTEPIHDITYWRDRLLQAPAHARHQAVFRCDTDRWNRIAEKHREILRQTLGSNGFKLLDAGCAWGRLIELLPQGWIDKNYYVGVDLSPDFIELARAEYPGYAFAEADLMSPLYWMADKCFDLTVLVSMRPMVKRNMGNEAWETIESNLKRVSHRLLFLEYDENDNGELVDC